MMEEVKIKPTPIPNEGETIVTKPTPIKTNEEEVE